MLFPHMMHTPVMSSSLIYRHEQFKWSSLWNFQGFQTFNWDVSFVLKNVFSPSGGESVVMATSTDCVPLNCMLYFSTYIHSCKCSNVQCSKSGEMCRWQLLKLAAPSSLTLLWLSHGGALHYVTEPVINLIRRYCF